VAVILTVCSDLPQTIEESINVGFVSPALSKAHAVRRRLGAGGADGLEVPNKSHRHARRKPE
jgi:hypothetical protein